jgi:transcription elongation factor GreA
MTKTQVTKQGLEALQNELNNLVETKRPKLVERLSFARSQGDLSENNDYQNAKEELEFLDGRIAELEEVLKNAVVVKTKNGRKSSVDVGTRVILKVDGQKQMFFVVGEWEADPKEKKISHTSPLGKALVGKKIGDKVDVEAPAGKLTYEILSIK